KISSNPNEPAYLIQLCSLYWRLGRRTEASDLIAKLLEQQTPRKAAVHLAVGDFYGSIERWGDATEQFREGMRVDSEQKTLFQKRIVNVFLAEDKRKEAANLVEEILKQQPRDPEALKIRAGLGIQSQRAEATASAIADYRELLKDNNLDATLH